MTRLLVSVRNVDEALLAANAGADLIDIKEPRRGSLGAADFATWTSIVDALAGSVPISAALGELCDIDVEKLSKIPAGVQYAKLGLAGCGCSPDWPVRWRDALAVLPIHVQPVAVVYADAGLAEAPSMAEIVDCAVQLGCVAVLVDTFDKRAGSLSTHWLLAEIRTFVLDVQSRGMLAVLAGGLELESVPEILASAPDFVAVRGAVCRGDRTGELDADKVQSLRSLVHADRTLLVRATDRAAAKTFA